MIFEISKFKNTIRALKMVRNELEQNLSGKINTLNHDEKRILYERIREIDEAIIVLRTYKEDGDEEK